MSWKIYIASTIGVVVGAGIAVAVGSAAPTQVQYLASTEAAKSGQWLDAAHARVTSIEAWGSGKQLVYFGDVGCLHGVTADDQLLILNVGDRVHLVGRVFGKVIGPRVTLLDCTVSPIETDERP